MPETRPSNQPNPPPSDRPKRVYLRPLPGETPEEFAKRFYQALTAAAEPPSDDEPQ
jgi:hypothetical protein